MSENQKKKSVRNYHTKDSFFKVLYVLMKKSDAEHPLSQAEIKKLIDKEFSEDVNEKTIPVALKKIEKLFALYPEMFGEFHHGAKDYDEDDEDDEDPGKKRWFINNYIQHVFEDHELRLLVDMISSADYMDFSERKDLLDKIYGLSSEHFKKVYTANIYKYVPTGNIKRVVILGNIKSIHNAIKNKKKITFGYLKRTTKGTLEMRTDDDGNVKEYSVSPYRTVFNDGFYYLICGREEKTELDHFRIDRMIFVEETNENAISERIFLGDNAYTGHNKYVSSHITMWSGNPERVTFKCPKWAVNEVADFFGDDYRIIKTEQDKTEDGYKEMLIIEVHSAIDSMRFWAYRFMDFIEVKTPKSLREEIKDKLKERCKVYCD